MKHTLLCLVACAILGASSSSAQQAVDQSSDEAGIRAMAAAVVEAYNRHDAVALAELWSPDAVYVNRSTGEQVVGRAAIAQQFDRQFQDQPGVKLENVYYSDGQV
jgi:ketosteroid isomerase-like protein